MSGFDIARLAEDIDRQLAARGLTARDGATEIGISQATMSRVRRGHHPDSQNLAHIVSWLDVDADRYIFR